MMQRIEDVDLKEDLGRRIGAVPRTVDNRHSKREGFRIDKEARRRPLRLEAAMGDTVGRKEGVRRPCAAAAEAGS